VAIGPITQVALPFPSTWELNASVAGRPLRTGRLVISSVVNNRVMGTVNFRGTPLPFQGMWNESTKQLSFDTPFSTFVGHLTFFDEPPINMRHYMLRGRLRMKPPSTWAGENGTWTATTSFRLR